MTKERPISEEDLHGFVDGFLASDRQVAVERHLRNDPNAAARIRGWQTSREATTAAYSVVAMEPVPPSLNVARLAASRHAHRWSPTRVAAGFALALALGGGAGWFAHDPVQPAGLLALALQAADAHRVFAEDMVHPVEFNPIELSEQLGWIGDRIRHKIMVPDLSADGYRLLGGRIIATQQGPACLFLYDGGRHGRISILMRLMRDGDLDSPMRPIQVNDAAGFAWSRHGLGVGLVADQPSPGLRNFSDEVRDAMASRI